MGIKPFPMEERVEKLRFQLVRTITRGATKKKGGRDSSSSLQRRHGFGTAGGGSRPAK